jgi:hypothetical protein
MIFDLSAYRHSNLEAKDDVFTHRYIEGVKPEDIFNTVSSVINPYGLPTVTLNIIRRNGLADIHIQSSDSFMHGDYLYDRSRFPEMFHSMQTDSIVIDMKFNGTFYHLDGAIDNLGGYKFMTLGE